MVKIYFAAKQAYVDDMTLPFIEFLTVFRSTFCGFPAITPSILHNYCIFFLDANLVLELALVSVQVLATGVSFYFIVNIETTNSHPQLLNFSATC